MEDNFSPVSAGVKPSFISTSSIQNQSFGPAAAGEAPFIIYQAPNVGMQHQRKHSKAKRNLSLNNRGGDATDSLLVMRDYQETIDNSMRPPHGNKRGKFKGFSGLMAESSAPGLPHAPKQNSQDRRFRVNQTIRHKGEKARETLQSESTPEFIPSTTLHSKTICKSQRGTLAASTPRSSQNRMAKKQVTTITHKRQIPVARQGPQRVSRNQEKYKENFIFNSSHLLLKKQTSQQEFKNPQNPQPPRTMYGSRKAKAEGIEMAPPMDPKAFYDCSDKGGRKKRVERIQSNGTKSQGRTSLKSSIFEQNINFSVGPRHNENLKRSLVVQQGQPILSEEDELKKVHSTKKFVRRPQNKEHSNGSYARGGDSQTLVQIQGGEEQTIFDSKVESRPQTESRPFRQNHRKLVDLTAHSSKDRGKGLQASVNRSSQRYPRGTEDGGAVTLEDFSIYGVESQYGQQSSASMKNRKIQAKQFGSTAQGRPPRAGAEESATKKIRPSLLEQLQSGETASQKERNLNLAEHLVRNKNQLMALRKSQEDGQSKGSIKYQKKRELSSKPAQGGWFGWSNSMRGGARTLKSTSIFKQGSELDNRSQVFQDSQRNAHFNDPTSSVGGVSSAGGDHYQQQNHLKQTSTSNIRAKFYHQQDEDDSMAQFTSLPVKKKTAKHSEEKKKEEDSPGKISNRRHSALPSGAKKPPSGSPLKKQQQRQRRELKTTSKLEIKPVPTSGIESSRVTDHSRDRRDFSADDRPPVSLDPKDVVLESTELKIEDLKSMPGFQVKTYPNAIYIGTVSKEGSREGLGVMKYKNGRQYEGGWLGDLREGKGFERYPKGNTYFGEFKVGKAHGKGVYTWSNGEVYDGEWVQGLKQGYGIWKGTQNDSYVGEWHMSKAHGYGVHKWPNGDTYEGEWKMCLKHGRGTDTFSTGDSYTGDFKNGKQHGKGKYIWASGAVYAGDFDDGVKHGKGKWRSQKNGGKANHYEGDYSNDLKHGWGFFSWSSGNTYQGQYFEDERQGFGKMSWTDGSSYEGRWEHGIQHGYGKMVFANGAVTEGLFENNVFKCNADLVEQSVLEQYRYQNEQSAQLLSMTYGCKTEKSRSPSLHQQMRSTKASFGDHHSQNFRMATQYKAKRQEQDLGRSLQVRPRTHHDGDVVETQEDEM